MAKDPAFLFYSSDFLTGVSDLTFEERGQYITLLCLQHQKGRLSKKAIDIATPNATADVLAKFKQDKKGLYFNERLEKEAKKRAEHSEKQKQRAIDGWKKRKDKSHDNATALATAMPLEDEIKNRNRNRKDKNEDENENELILWPSFEDFWNLYDKKINKLDTEKKWNKLKQDVKELIIEHVTQYVAENTDKKFRRDPLTYLNNESWNDEIIKTKTNGKSSTTKERNERFADYAREFGANG